MGELNKLPNIGPELERLIKLTGIASAEELIKTGSRATFTRIMTIDPDSCINKLYALEGACKGIRWHDLDKDEKRELNEFYNLIKKK
jgi:DNA transformation protein